MALFNRQKKEDILPQEVREYYDSERRERAGIAWLLAIGTLIATFVIAAGLFFGGRWAYRTVFHHNDNKTTATNDPSKDGLRVDENGNVVGGSSQSTSDNSSTSQSSSSTGTSSTSTNVPSPSTSSSSSSTTKPTTTPNTGPTPASLIDTGPGNDE